MNQKSGIYGRCPKCGGTGLIYKDIPLGVNPKAKATKGLETQRKCPYCHGRGYVGC